MYCHLKNQFPKNFKKSRKHKVGNILGSVKGSFIWKLLWFIGKNQVSPQPVHLKNPCKPMSVRKIAVKYFWFRLILPRYKVSTLNVSYFLCRMAIFGRSLPNCVEFCPAGCPNTGSRSLEYVYILLTEDTCRLPSRFSFDQRLRPC